MPVVIIRPFNNYGPNQHLEKVVPRFITSALKGEPLTIHGDGRNTRDWLYVLDTCRALDKVMHVNVDEVKGQVINIGTGRDIDILTIAEMVLDKLNKPRSLLTYMDDRPAQIIKHFSSVDKASRIIQWRAETSFEEGLSKTVEWYERNLEWWKNQLWMTRVPIKTRNGKIEYY
jgi:dTDP-glucose 4,6-dehydratase